MQGKPAFTGTAAGRQETSAVAVTTALRKCTGMA